MAVNNILISRLHAETVSISHLPVGDENNLIVHFTFNVCIKKKRIKNCPPFVKTEL